MSAAKPMTLSDTQLQIAELKVTLQVSSKSLEQSHHRLNDIMNLSKEKKTLENREDSMIYCLRYWFVLIRCKIIAPKSMDIADTSRPTLSSDSLSRVDLLSDPMKEAIREAAVLELLDFVDVNTAISNFSTIGWCLIALSILRRKPKVEELQLLSSSYSVIKVPDAKCVALIRSMITRATSWQSQIRQLFDLASANSHPSIEASTWHEQLSLASSIPMITQEYTWLENIIADGCSKHCICQGPVRLSLMLSCDACGKWFHGSCVQVSEAEAESSPIWTCPSCSGSTTSHLEKKDHSRVRRWKPSYDEDDVSNIAPNPSLIWPPFGLSDNPEAVACFGGLVCSIDLANMKRPQVPPQSIQDETKCEEHGTSGNMENHLMNGTPNPQSTGTFAPVSMLQHGILLSELKIEGKNELPEVSPDLSDA